jgi:hypothetical protein
VVLSVSQFVWLGAGVLAGLVVVHGYFAEEDRDVDEDEELLAVDEDRRNFEPSFFLQPPESEEGDGGRVVDEADGFDSF